MDTRDSLFRAVLNAPDDDLPRLVYADFLDESGDPDRAEFIRVQCRLAKSTPADADHFDLKEREAELQLILDDRLLAEEPPLPDGHRWQSPRRGFVDRVVYSNRGANCPLDQIADELDHIATLAPLCGLWAGDGLNNRLPQLFSLPVCRRLSYLFVDHILYSRSADEHVGALAAAENLGNLRELELSFLRLTANGWAALGRSPHLARLTHVDANLASGGTLNLFQAATWRESIERLSFMNGNQFTDVAGTTAFPNLSALHLSDHDLTPRLTEYLNAPDHCPQLASLSLLGGMYDLPAAATPVGALERPIRALSLSRPNLLESGLSAVLQSPGVRAVRSLSLSHPWVNADGFRAFADCHLPELRELELGHPFDGESLRWLAESPMWNTVTTARLNGYGSTAKGTDWAEFFRRLRAPRLRHLSIGGLKLQSRGGLALAENRSLTNLRKLVVAGCGLGERAGKAILTAPQFQGLLILHLGSNGLNSKAVQPLADPTVLPHAVRVNLMGNAAISPAVTDQLQRRAGVRVVSPLSLPR